MAHTHYREIGELPRVRLEYPALGIFLLGGLAGTLLNAAVTIALARPAGSPVPLAFFCGTMANLLFHHVYYHLIFINREIKLRTPLWVQLFLYVTVSAGVAGAAWLLVHGLNMSFWAVLPLILGGLALVNSLVNRIQTFSSAQLSEIEYAGVDESFYFDQTDPHKVNAIRAWFHSARFRRLTETVRANYRPGMKVADLGCGNCLWNTDKIPVTGVDVNAAMLKWAKTNGYLGDFRISEDLSDTGLPDKEFDIVVMSETIEHLLKYHETILEVGRILKPDGKFIITVPYDIFLGPFFVMFNVNCLYQGLIRGSKYHLYRCGHVNHFTIRRLTRVLNDAGFRVESTRVLNGLTLFAVAVPEA
jgi:2-polyprenyl-3-methyl-5-hydroxy-6-metoxy-1,4-benzoquinol methylase